MTTPKPKPVKKQTIQQSTDANTEATAENTTATAKNTAAHSDSAEAISAAVELADAMTKFGNDVRDLKSTDRRRKRILRVLAVSVAFDIALSVGLGYGLVKINHTSSACVQANRTRAAEKSLWDKVLTLPPPAIETAQAKADRLKSTAEFKVFLDKNFAPTKC